MKEGILAPFNKEGVAFSKIYAFSHNNKNFLLGENGTYIILDDELFDKYMQRDFTEQLAMKFIQRGLARTTDSPDIVSPDAIIAPAFFMISLTNTCNMRCKYCFNHFNSDNAAVISIEKLGEIIDYIVDYYRQNKAEHISIQAWGGEPLLCMEHLEYMYHRLTESGIRYTICLETNGSLITNEIAAKLKAMNIQVGISIDGYEQIQNEQRPLYGNVESFKKVTEGMKFLNTYYDHKFGSITVVTKLVLEHLEEIIDYFVKELQLRSIKFNIARLPENNEMALSLDEIEDFATRLVDKMSELSLQGYTTTEGTIVDRLKTLLLRSTDNICHSHGCQGGRRMISFDVNGNIFPCEMTDYPEECLGNISNDKDLVKLISQRQGKGYFAPKNLSSCENCPFLYFCQGGCTTSIIYKKGCVEGIDESGCHLNKAIYRRLIQVILEKPQLAEQMMSKQ